MARKRDEQTDRDSEARYRALFESTGDAIMLLDERGFLECNQATLQFFGCASPEEFISKHPSELSPPMQPDGTDSRTAADARIATAYRDGVARFEWMHRRIDGSEMMADVLLARVDLADRSILQAVVRDISQRKAAEKALHDAHAELERRVEKRTASLASANEELRREIAERQRAEEKLAFERFLLTTLMQHGPDFIYFKDAQSRFLRISKALAEYYGLKDPSEAIGRTDSDFYDTRRAEQYLDDERQIMQSGRAAVDREEEQFWPDGRQTWLLTSKVPLYDPTGQIIGTFGVSRDITRRKRAEVKLQAATQAAEAANQAKSDFLANMSHEIRTPMNAIIGITELLLGSELTNSQRDYLKMVCDSGEALLTLINDVLDFSKIEAGKLELERAPFDVRESLGDTMKSLGLRAHSKGLELACEVRPDVPERLLGDAGRLRQVVVNLVSNAVKFTEVGEVVLRVDCRGRTGDGALLHFAIADTGIGIPEEKQAVIFDAFEQADRSTTRRFHGTGLGLAISSRLVDSMGGEIWVESQPGRGSTFHFTARFGRAPAEAPGATLKPPAVRGTRVLVVDDNATNRHILEQMLGNWEMQPVTAAGVDEALEVLRQAQQDDEPFGLILTDANMPEIDGFALAHRVKRDGELQSTVIMMLTSGDRPGDVARCERLGIASYLLKPVKQSELFDAIVMALGVTAAEEPEPAEESASSAAPLPPQRVLLAEDSLVNQKLAVGLLQKYGHTVVVANHGREALAAWQAQPFDVILMDVQMPELDGFEATEAIRTRERKTGTRTPIIALTAHAMKGDRRRCLEAGMDAYVAKPIRVQQLLETMRSVIGAPDGPLPESPSDRAVASGAESPVDWSEALATVEGDRALLGEMIEAFREESPRLMDAIRQAVADGDGEALRIAAHTLKGPLRSFGAGAAFEPAFRLEQIGRQGDLTDAEATSVVLEAELARLLPALDDCPQPDET